MYDTSVPFENLYGYELGTRVEQELKSLNIQQIKSTNAEYENLRHCYLHTIRRGLTRMRTASFGIARPDVV